MSPTLCCSRHPGEDYETLGQIISPPSFLFEVWTKSWICSFEGEGGTQKQTMWSSGGSLGSAPLSLQFILNCWTHCQKWMLLLKSWNFRFFNCLLPKCNRLPAVLHWEQLAAAPAFMPMSELTWCYWNLGWKCYSQDSRLTSSKLREPFNSTGIQTLGRWEQVGLDGIVCCLSNCFTPLCSKTLLYLWGLHWARGGRRKKMFAWSQTVQLWGKKLCQCRAKSSLGLNNKQKNGICQQGAKTKSSESKKGWQGRGRKDKKRKMRLMYAKSTHNKIILKQRHCVPKLLGEKQVD